jgi:lipid II:glycine glycyltransferase (peptidoglycan interpeptide bridge formation enzyme)
MLVDSTRWAEFITDHSDAHLLQTAEWAELKSSFGWQAERIIAGDTGAQILFRRLPLGYSIAYIPKGPLGWNDVLLAEIDSVCKRHRAIFLKIEPFDWEPGKEWHSLEQHGFFPSAPIQPPRTVTISLADSEEDILAGMKQKTRYNIRLAEKKGVVVKSSQDYAAFHRMALVTGTRDQFGIHALGYYLKMQKLFEPVGNCILFMAYYEDRPLAGIIVFAQGKSAWYMYGASTDEERNRMPTYLLQWEAIKWARQRGCATYDLWGIPDFDEEELERRFAEKPQHEGLWGVYRFKRGFGGTVCRSVGAWDKVYLPVLYWLYKLYTTLRKRGVE